jgi:hypothetical protein
MINDKQLLKAQIDERETCCGRVIRIGIFIDKRLDPYLWSRKNVVSTI